MKLTNAFDEVDKQNANQIIAAIAKIIHGQPLDDTLAALFTSVQLIGESDDLAAEMVKFGCIQTTINLSANQNYEHN